MIKSSVKIKIPREAFVSWDKDDTKAIANFIMRLIKQRIASGKDVNNVPFKPYTSEYAYQKGSTDVNLRNSGRMLDSMGVKITKDSSAEVSVSPTYSVHVDKRRSFMGLSEAEVNKVMEFVAKLFDKHIEENNKSLRTK